jgi:hypothetical protein
MLLAKHQTMDAILDSPRYSTGYTSLFNTIGFVVETHAEKIC